MSHAVQAVDASSFVTLVVNASRPVVVDFWAPWCGPCRALAPVLEEVAKRFAGQVEVRKINVDDAPQIASTFGVRGVPTLILFAEGQPQSRMVGIRSEEELSEWVRSAL